MRILITGADGYIGWPLFLKFIYQNPKIKIIGIDNFLRRKLVKRYSENNYKKVYSMKERIKELKLKGKKNFKFINLDLLDKKKTYNLLKKFKPDIIFHLACQPSAPFANKNLNNSVFTSKNNNLSTLNLLWSLKELNLLKTLPATPFAKLGSFFTLAFILFFKTSNISLKLPYVPLVGNLS